MQQTDWGDAFPDESLLHNLAGDAIFDHFPLFEKTLRLPDLCNGVISHIQGNLPKSFQQHAIDSMGSSAIVIQPKVLKRVFKLFIRQTNDISRSCWCKFWKYSAINFTKHSPFCWHNSITFPSLWSEIYSRLRIYARNWLFPQTRYLYTFYSTVQCTPTVQWVHIRNMVGWDLQ